MRVRLPLLLAAIVFLVQAVAQAGTYKEIDLTHTGAEGFAIEDVTIDGINYYMVSGGTVSLVMRRPVSMEAPTVTITNDGGNTTLALKPKILQKAGCTIYRNIWINTYTQNCNIPCLDCGCFVCDTEPVTMGTNALLPVLQAGPFLIPDDDPVE